MRNCNWSIEEDEILQNNYGIVPNRVIETLLQNRNISAITQRAYKLGINKKNYHSWKDIEIDYLINNYRHTAKKQLISDLGINWSSIKTKAKELKLKRQTKQMDKIQGNPKILLEETYVSYYWIGFLLADGHFSKKYRLKLSLSIKDNDHIKKFAEYINASIIYEASHLGYPAVTIMDSFNIKNIMKKFDINSNKTYNPPDLNIFKNISDDLMFCLICGFIDGDGCIRKQYNRDDVVISIKIHNSWDKILKYFFIFLQKYFNIEMKSKLHYIDNCVYLLLSNNKLIKEMKKKIILFSLPVMDRKWAKII